MKISELSGSTRNVEVEATVVEKEEARDVNTKYGRTRVANATIEDDSGRFKLTLWGEHADKVAEGNKIKITNGFVSSFRDELQLSVGKFGKLEIL
jgi:replication factor A1